MSTQHCSRPPHQPYRLVVNRHRSHPGLGLIALVSRFFHQHCQQRPQVLVPAFELAWGVGRMGIGKLPKPTRIPFG
ncbi:hypothetical protein Plhal304r1_c012g0044921 [Plasmopara halstedii]